LRKALPLVEKQAGPTSEDAARVINNLATIDSSQGRFEQADVLFKRALSIKEKLYGAEHFEVAVACSNLGLNFERWRRLHEAEPLYLRALAISEKLAAAGQPAEFGYTSPSQALNSALENLGNLKLQQGQYAEAEPYYRRALQLQEKAFGENSPATAQTLSNLAALLERQQKFAEAEPLLDRAIRIAEAGEAGSELRYNILVSRSIGRWLMDRRSDAIDDLNRALDIAEAMRAKFSGDEVQRAQASTHHFSRAFELLVGYQRDLGNVEEAFLAIERNRARTLIEQINLQGIDLLAALSPAEASELRKRDAEAAAAVAEIERQFAELASKPDAPNLKASLQELSAKLRAAREKSVAAYRDIRNASPTYRLSVSQDYRPVPLATIHQWVKQQSGLLLEYFVGSEHAYVVAIPADGEPEILMLPELNAELAEALGTSSGWLNEERLRQALSLDGKPLSEIYKQPAAREGDLASVLQRGNSLLWNLLIPEQYRSKIVAGAYARLAIVPDAGLHGLPFDGLVVDFASADGEPKYLLDVGPPIIYAPSATVLYNLSQHNETAASSESTTRKQMLSIGNPAYGRQSRTTPAKARQESASALSQFATIRGELKPLPYSAQEVSWIASTFQEAGWKTRTLTKTEATEQAVRQSLPGCSIVHLACHAIADQSHGNLFGALALAATQSVDSSLNDGFLTLGEIYQLNLTDCQLALLSACETNLGPQLQGEGSFALSRGFLVAGARRVAATNWVVDDASSASLASMFCSVLVKQQASGKALDYALALQQAKKWVRKREKWRHPYYWAAFSLVGPP
jgi:CHAT domain-containing protein